MKKTVPQLFALILIVFSTACKREAPVPDLPEPTVAVQAAVAASPTARPTPTPVPTQTPIPAKRVHNGDQALFIGDWEAALVEYDKALKSSSDPDLQAAALLGTAQAYWLGRNPYETGRALERLLTDYPFFEYRADAYFLLARMHETQNRYLEAAGAYTHYLDLRPEPIGAYIYNWRGDAFYNAAKYAEAAEDFRLALDAPSRLQPDLLRLKMARSYALAGDHPTALLIYDDLYNLTSDDNTRALIDLRKAEIYTNLGQTEAANAAYLDAVQKYPASIHAYTALATLVDAGIQVDELQRGIIDYYAGQYGVAQAAFERYLNGSPADPATALYFYGLAKRELGEHAASIEKWSVLIDGYPDHSYWDEAWDQKAYTQWAFLDQYPQAVETLLGFADAAPQHPRAAEFLLDAGLVSERDGKLDQAAEIWDRLARSYPADERAARGLFLMGIALYRLENYSHASDAFSRSLAAAVAPADRAAAQLWVGKAQEALGDEAAARLAWERAAEIDPTGYYSERARDLISNRPVFDPPLAYDLAYDIQRERRRAEDWLKQTFNLPEDATDLSGPGPLASNLSLLRGAELWRLGMYEQARLEFETVRSEAAADPVLSYRLANFLLEIGAYRPAIMAGRQVLDLAGLSDADTFSAPVFFNHLRFGIYFSDILLDLAERYDIHPLLLYSVVRQESLFEGFAQSSAGAQGLMQIIPSTGQDIADRLGWPKDYAPEDLGRPQVNLTFGVDYLAAQRKAFNGDWYAALAAYNGGQGNARVWHELAGGDPDLFLEVIRFAETRNYIRGVSELFNIYRLLYDRSL